ncbi:RDD family protein [Streptomyces sp. NPDC057702]|uniref:RDD family protein n=1 Tax=unclassified Streptomyces TaxID=2593676 RepID=UPI00368F0436
MDDAAPTAPAPLLPRPVPVDQDWLPRRPWPAWIRIYPTQPGEPHPADLPERLSAYLVDILAFGLLTFLTALPSLFVDRLPAAPVAALAAVALLLCYSPLTTARWGGSPGKLLFGLRVAREQDGAALPYRLALGRHLTHVGMVVLCGLDQLWFLWDEPCQQCLHDAATGTVVVRTEPPRAWVPGSP